MRSTDTVPNERLGASPRSRLVHRTRRWMFVALALCAQLGSACGSEPISTPQIETWLQGHLQNSPQLAGLKIGRPDCPDVNRSAIGSQFSCRVTFEDLTVDVTLKRRDETTVELVDMPTLIPSTTLEKTIVEMAQKEGTVASNVNCGRRLRLSVAGEEFVCKANLPGLRTPTNVRVKIENDSGRITILGDYEDIRVVLARELDCPSITATRISHDYGEAWLGKGCGRSVTMACAPLRDATGTRCRPLELAPHDARGSRE